MEVKIEEIKDKLAGVLLGRSDANKIICAVKDIVQKKKFPEVDDIDFNILEKVCEILEMEDNLKKIKQMKLRAKILNKAKFPKPIENKQP